MLGELHCQTIAIKLFLGVSLCHLNVYIMIIKDGACVALSLSRDDNQEEE